VPGGHAEPGHRAADHAAADDAYCRHDRPNPGFRPIIPGSRLSLRPSLWPSLWPSFWLSRPRGLLMVSATR
jgi:hypothetical protein